MRLKAEVLVLTETILIKKQTASQIKIKFGGAIFLGIL